MISSHLQRLDFYSVSSSNNVNSVNCYVVFHCCHNLDTRHDKFHSRYVTLMKHIPESLINILRTTEINEIIMTGKCFVFFLCSKFMQLQQLRPSLLQQFGEKAPEVSHQVLHVFHMDCFLHYFYFRYYIQMNFISM